MNRRDAISRVTLIMGGTIIGAEFFLSGCKSFPKNAAELSDKDNVSFLDEVGETILPATHTPGAKAAQIGSFMAFMVNDCYDQANQQIFVNGITKLNDACRAKFNKDFMDCDATQRTALLTALDQEQQKYTKTKKKEEPNHYFRMMKELTILGFFTSKEGCTEALRYIAIPGRFDGDIPYRKGDKAWAT